MFLILNLTILANVHRYFFNLDSVLRYEHKLLEPDWFENHLLHLIALLK